MRRIIDDKLYDTDKAEKVAKFKREVKFNSILGAYIDEVDCELYRTSEGCYFEVIGIGRGSKLFVVSEGYAMTILGGNENAMSTMQNRA